MIFCHLRVRARKLASPFGHPTQVSMHAGFNLGVPDESVDRAYTNIHLAVAYKSDYFGMNLNSQVIPRVTKFTSSVLFGYTESNRSSSPQQSK